MSIIDLITLFVFLAAAFTLINLSILKLPTTIGLMFIALMTSITVVILGYFFPPIRQTATDIMTSFDFKEVLLGIILNFLLFAGALTVDLSKLLQERAPILILAFVSTFISIFVTGYLAFYIFPLFGVHIDLIYCLLFGALISPTDPVAVLALIKKLGLAKRLEIQIAGESLFNDGIGVVFYVTILSVAEMGMDSLEMTDVLVLFGTQVIGGVLVGGVLGYLGFKALLHIDNEHTELEVLVTLTLVMVGTRVGELMGASVAIAMVVLGLFIGNEGRDSKFANATGEYVFKFWHLVDETFNAILFILIGMEIIIIAQSFGAHSVAVGLSGIAIVLLARYIGVIIPIKAMSFFRKFEPRTVFILVWGGLRGGIPVALALSLSKYNWDPEVKETILLATYAVVVFSILVQGLTISKFIKR